MTLPTTLAEIQAMGRDALQAIVRCYMSAFGLDAWEITAKWVEVIDGSETAVGACVPDPVYHRASIDVLWPPVGDVEETIAHELAHCLTAELALLADAAPGTWARAAWERVAEQMARGAVALRRRGARVPVVLSRAFRGNVAALRREGMDPKKLAELAMKAGEMAAREDVPEDVRGLLAEFVAALAGGDVGGEEPPMTTDPDAPPMATDPDAEQMPAYVQAFERKINAIAETVQRLSGSMHATAQQPAQPSAELIEVRRTSVETFLSTKPGVLSAEMERRLVDKGDLKLAREIVAEVERRPVQRGAHREQGRDEQSGPKLSPVQLQMAARHGLKPEQYAKSLQRQQDQRAFRGRAGGVK